MGALKTARSKVGSGIHVVGKSLNRGGEKRRSVLAAWRTGLAASTVVSRRRSARELKATPPFIIDPDLGYCLVTPDSGPPEAAEVIAETLNVIEKADLSVKKKQQLLTGLLDSVSLDHQSRFVRLGLREDLIGSVAAYLGVVPLLSDIDVWYSRWTGETFQNSQLFHCDWADRSQIKLFLFANDVTTSNGPLTIIDAARSARLRSAIRYTYGGSRARVQDARVEEVLGRSSQTVLTGPRGTLALVDTSRCFHQGSRVDDPEQHRIMALYQYLTPTAFSLPLRPRDGAPFSGLADSSMSTLQLMCLGAR